MLYGYYSMQSHYTLKENESSSGRLNIVQTCCRDRCGLPNEYALIQRHARREKDRRRRRPPPPPPPPPLPSLKLNYKSSLQIHIVAGRQTHTHSRIAPITCMSTVYPCYVHIHILISLDVCLFVCM